MPKQPKQKPLKKTGASAERTSPVSTEPSPAISPATISPTARPDRLRDTRARRVKEAILDAATAIFAEKGLDGATLQEIATASGARQTLLLYHFGSKGALWEAAAERLAQRFDVLHSDCFERLPPPTDDRERVHALFVSFARALRQLPAYGRMLLQEGYRPAPRLLWHAHHLIPQAHRPMAFANPTLMRELGELSLLRAAASGATLFLVVAGPQLARSAAEQGGEPPAELDPLSDRLIARLADMLCELVFREAAEQTVGATANGPSQLGLQW